MLKTIKNFHKSLSSPDERRQFKSHGYLDVTSFEDGSAIGKGVFEPGWKWSNDVKPIVGTESCETSHMGYCLQGEITIRMNDGKEFKIKKGDAFSIPPGHDAWVDGHETCELIDFMGYKEYAKEKSAQEKNIHEKSA